MAQDSTGMLGGRGRAGVTMVWAATLLAALASSAPVGASTAPRPVRSDTAASFSGFVAALWPAARARGVSRSTFDRAFAGVDPDPDVMALTRKQSEFTKTTGQYLLSAVSDKRIAAGTAKYKEWAPWLVKAERRYGVDRYVILGVWGLETNFGQYSGNSSVIRSLATLAYHRYRGEYFRRELIAALESFRPAISMRPI